MEERAVHTSGGVCSWTMAFLRTRPSQAGRTQPHVEAKLMSYVYPLVVSVCFSLFRLLVPKPGQDVQIHKWKVQKEARIGRESPAGTVREKTLPQRRASCSRTHS